MDVDGSMAISLDEFDPEAHQTFEKFKECLQTKYGTIERAWNEGLAKNSPGGLSADLFLAGCARVGYDGDAKKLLKYLDTEEFGMGRITMDELEFLGLPTEDDLAPRKAYKPPTITLERGKRE